jgi:hypothetical protein
MLLSLLTTGVETLAENLLLMSPILVGSNFTWLAGPGGKFTTGVTGMDANRRKM